MSDKDMGASAWRCETCKHWSMAEPDWQFDELLIGKCTRARMREDIETDATCHLADGRWDDEAEPLIKAALIAAKVIAVDGSGYYAALRTMSDFGCVLHEPFDAPEGGQS